MGKTEDQLDRDASALIKMLLSEMEVLARLDPVLALEPYTWDQRRRTVVRKIYSFYRDVKNGRPNEPQRNQHPE